VTVSDPAVLRVVQRHQFLDLDELLGDSAATQIAMGAEEVSQFVPGVTG
jgi:hypothetical protein